MAGASRGARRLRAGLLGLAAGSLLLLRSPIEPCVDLCTYYAAGRVVAAGAPAGAYDRVALTAAHVGTHAGTKRIGGFLYSPLYLPAAGLLAHFPYPAAEALHRVAGALLLGCGLALVLLRLGDPLLELALALAFLLSHTAWTQLIFQNWGIGLFAALAAALAAGRTGRGAAAALSWALAGHLKIFVVLMAAPLVATRWWRRILLAALAALALALLSLPWVGLASWRAWIDSIGSLSARGVTPYYNKVSLAAGLARFAVDPRAWLAPREPAAELLTRALLVLGVAVLVAVTARLRRDPERLLAASIATVLLFVPQIWDHTEILLFVALPALPRRALWCLVGCLALTVGYAPLVARGLAGALGGSAAPVAVAALLMLYPLLNLAVLGSTLAAGPRATTVDDA